ncbi:3-oxoacyl-ACP reductase [Anaerocolumna cellulosilytica]|uniref:3-oxoacyl-ACP reductase n=1 Tax=Anaerocolumna cellulosilytica TaxID=433286 RepID=A0A6S6QT46_9FIRM|nr:SDR family oxidoreductase [Anaerocolumna cellulosilytica]MBB5194274.1 hypothetical protein [Anaerocolumna cellulosilytica]BCJ94513.1 3-oxoacyl-ACP reductase [Anaerocolumna cellulosilytica]
MKSALVTGASSGIGLEITRVLLDNQYKVYGIGRDFKEQSFAVETFIPVRCDVTNTQELSKKIEEIKASDTISLLVNNAGLGYFGPHEELNAKKIHEMVCVNLEVPMLLTQLLLRDIKRQRGYIINISSITAGKSNTHGCAYGATKAGLTSFSKSLFDEVRKYGVKVTSIHPDMTQTNFYRNADFMEGHAEDTYLLPGEVAKAVEMILHQREGMLVSDITLQPQKHQINRKK